MGNEQINIILIHGAWHGGWCWDRVCEKLTSRDFKLHTPTLNGMNSYNDPQSKTTGLHDHIKQIVDYILDNNLDNVVLLGHSYAGMVITGVAHKIPNKIDKLIYLDAFVPNDGEALFKYSRKESIEKIEKSLVDNNGKTLEEGAEEVWLIPTRDPRLFKVDFPDDIEFLEKNMVPMPVACFKESIKADNPLYKDLDKYYIRCVNDKLFIKVDEEKLEKDFKYYEIKAGHDIMISEADKFVEVFLEIINA